MKVLIRLIISLEKLIKNPVNWFDQQPWLLRTTLVLLLIPLISAASIISYQKIYLADGWASSQNSYDRSTQEMSDLRQDLEKFHDSQIREIAYLSEDIAQLKKTTAATSSTELVLGIEDSEIEGNLRQRLRDIALAEAETDLIYIKTDIEEEVSVFISPLDSTQKLAILEKDSYYPALIEENDWQQISLSDGQLGWVKKEFIIKFPLNENN